MAFLLGLCPCVRFVLLFQDLRVVPRPQTITPLLPKRQNVNQATNQAVSQVNQARPAALRSKHEFYKKVCSWLKASVLVISGLVIALAGLFISYYPARNSNSLASAGDDLAKVALDYTRYQTWCSDPTVRLCYSRMTVKTNPECV